MPAHGEAVLWTYNPSIPDNSVGPAFLSRLVLNADVQPRSYWKAVEDAQAVSLQVSLVVAVVEVFLLLLTRRVSAQSVVLLVLVITVFGQLFVRAVGGKQLGGNLLRAIRQTVLLLTGVYLLSPLYSTLTKSISDDTIVATSTWLLLIHLYMHDYHFVTSVADSLAGGVSLAAAVAASVLLASRLQRPNCVFAQVIFSLTTFIIFPFTCRHLHRLSSHGYSAVVLVSALVTVYFLTDYPLLWPIALLVLHIVLVFACPWFLLSIEKYKAQINGPWDEAIPRISTVLPPHGISSSGQAAL